MRESRKHLASIDPFFNGSHERAWPDAADPCYPNLEEIPMSAIPAINRLNSQHSTGPRTTEGKLRSSRNALRHGLTAASPVLPTEDPAAYETHRRQFLDEYQPATPTETQLVEELSDTSWRLRRIPLLEARLMSGSDPLPIVEAHRLLSNLNLQSTRLSRQFQKALSTLREIQSTRRDQERRQLKEAAALLELHKHKGIPWDPAADGFVFSKQRIEHHSGLLMRQNEARHIGYVLFEGNPRLVRAAGA